uniref:Uncharacterized protein n=1 Tax=Salmo trutta TaxID=8032 RepID=A0A674ACP3_SALTR
ASKGSVHLCYYCLLSYTQAVRMYQRSGEEGAHHRQRRSWGGNQFFVLEEYMGDEPLYVGKVRVSGVYYYSK